MCSFHSQCFRRKIFPNAATIAAESPEIGSTADEMRAQYLEKLRLAELEQEENAQNQSMEPAMGGEGDGSQNKQSDELEQEEEPEDAQSQSSVPATV